MNCIVSTMNYLTITIVFLLQIFNNVYSQLSLFPANITHLQNTRQLSSDCSLQLLNLDWKTFQLMFDSSTKIPNGAIDGGNFWDLGNFDECYNIESKNGNDILYGKYCLGTISISDDLLSKYMKNSSAALRVIPIHPNLTNNKTAAIGYHWAICVPHKCSAEEISAISTYTEQYCYSKDNSPGFTTGAIITIVILLNFLLISICSTIFDVYLYYMGNKPPHELLIAFSMLTNGRKLFNSTTNGDQLLCLNGIRAIGMMWVILGHTFAAAMNAPLINTFDVYKYLHNQWNMFMMDATLSVDTFFTVGGAVTIFTSLKSIDKGVKFNVISYYIHRYLRLTPAFGICILVYGNLLKYLDNGPLWGEMELTLSDDCINYWWSSLFYISNYTLKVCVPQSWYLSVDMQLFLLSPLILIPLRWCEKIGIYLLSCLCILGIIVPFSISYLYGLTGLITVEAIKKYMSYYYIQTHMRFGPYVIGILLGYLLYKIKKGEFNLSLRPIHVCVLWLMTITGLIACIYAPFDTLKTHDKVVFALLLGFQRPAWSLGVCIVIFLCVSGYGGPIDKFLSLSIFQLLTKLSYSMYLVHFAVVYLQYFRMKTMIHFSNYDMMFIFWGNFILTFAVSILLCLCFESPVIVLEKYLFKFGGHTRGDKKPVA